MKTLLATILSASVIAVGISMPADAAPGAKRKAWNKPSARSRHLDRRQLASLPIRITRPPNSAHYIYRDYPLWAARAFQPTRDR